MVIYVKNKYIQWLVNQTFVILAIGLYITGAMVSQEESYTNGIITLLIGAASAGCLYVEYIIWKTKAGVIKDVIA